MWEHFVSLIIYSYFAKMNGDIFLLFRYLMNIFKVAKHNRYNWPWIWNFEFGCFCNYEFCLAHRSHQHTILKPQIPIFHDFFNGLNCLWQRTKKQTKYLCKLTCSKWSKHLASGRIIITKKQSLGSGRCVLCASFVFFSF